MKYRIAYAAVDHLAKLREGQKQTFLANIKKLLDAKPLLVPETHRSFFLKKSEDPLDERIERFSRVRRSFALALTSALAQLPESSKENQLYQQINKHHEPAMFEDIASFQAATVLYKESGTLLVDDNYYNESLKHLTLLGQITDAGKRSPAELISAIGLITAYYKEMDHTLAEKFYRSHHRSSPMGRVGPFSFSTGGQWEEVERQSIILSPHQVADLRMEIEAHFELNRCQRTNYIWLTTKVSDKPVAFSFHAE